MIGRCAALVALALLAGGCAPAAPSRLERGDLYLISALPLVFGDDFDLTFEPPRPIAAIGAHYRLRPVDLPSQVPDGALLLIAQPRSLPPAELVALDGWVRRGGRLVLLADPLLEWPSERPLGDRLRPPASFADTGLLAHWGLRLDGPDTRGPVDVAPDRGGWAVLSPGTLRKVGEGCTIEQSGVQAMCAIGHGRAIVVADADWIDQDRVERETGAVTDAAGRLESLLAQADARVR